MAETIKEFLVSLGWHVNQSDQDKFYRAMEGAVLRANLLAAALEGAARNIALKVADIAEDFESLNYQMQRTGASVATIRALEYAVSQLGGTVQGAGSSIDTFGRLLRTNPGERSWVETFFGISTKGKDTAQVMLDIGAAASKMYQPLVQGAGVLGQLGWDEKTMLALEKGPEAMARYNEELTRQGQAGIGDQTAEQATKFDQAARKIAAIAEDLMVGGESKIMAALVVPLSKLGTFLDQHSDAINDAFDDIATAIGEFAKTWEAKFEKLDWKAIGTSMEGIAVSVEHGATAIGGLTTALEGLATLWAASKLASIFVMLRGLGLINPVTAGFAGGMGALYETGALTDDPTGKPNWFQRMTWPVTGAIGNAVGTVKGWFGGGGSNGVGGWWTPDRINHAVSRLTTEAGLVARWSAVESPGGPTSVNPTSGAEGINQALGSRKPAGFATWSFDDQLSYIIKTDLPGEAKAWAQLRGAKTAGEGAIGGSMYERAEGYNPATGADNFTGATPVDKILKIIGTPSGPSLGINQGAMPWSKSSFGGSPNFWGAFNTADLSAAIAGAPSLAMPAAGAQVTSNQTNNIHVQASDPQSAAAMVGLHLDRTAADITRNLQGNIQ